MKLFDQTFVTLESALDVRLTRQNLLASNVANADTPNFRPKDVDFSKALSEARLRHDPVGGPPTIRSGDMPLQVVAVAADPSSSIVEAASGAPGLDGNRVDLDRTMASLSENALQYSASSRAVGKKLSILRFVAES